MKIRTAILLDNGEISKWQKDALEYAKDLLEIKAIINCNNTHIKRNLKKNFLYYILNFLSLRNSESKKRPFYTSESRVLSFNSEYDGMWQKIPDELLKQLDIGGIDLIIKFGMNLLKIEGELFKHTILSFHHGDPSKYRGRPAGFYEILNDEKKIGIIVQKLSNKLDAGKIYSFTETKVVDFSYKKTAMNFYYASKFSLRKAIVNLKNNNPVDVKTNGKNFKIPSNYLVLRFLLKLFFNKLTKINYGMFYEKRWKVAFGDKEILLEGKNKLSLEGLEEVPVLKRFNFYADPFFTLDGTGLRFEGLNNRTGLGEIVEGKLDNIFDQKIILSGNHYSYPMSFKYKFQEWLLPEVASHSPQYFYTLTRGLASKKLLRGLNKMRIVDATLFYHKDVWYLFFGVQDTAQFVLNLWISDDLLKSFKPHPNSPVCVSPTFARMAGKLVIKDNLVYRFGQNNEGQYGESITILKVDKISPKVYQEKPCGTVLIEGRKGPHTINFSPSHKKITVDYYLDKFSLFAGIRRIKARLAKF